MKVVLFGASGMVGQGVLRECLRSPDVERVLSVGRSATGLQDPKLREIVRPDVGDLEPLAGELAGYDGCFFCLGATSAGLDEAAYTRVTYDLTLAAARVLARVSPGMTFVYVSGAGTDSSEHGRSMWARVKGRTENALLALPFKSAVMFRPGLIRPMHGAVSKTRLYRLSYAVLGPLLPLLDALVPDRMTTTEKVGRAMINAVKLGAPKRWLESRDINALAARTA